LHLYETCGPGGAESVILDLVRHLDPKKFKSTVALLVEGWLTDRLKEAGISPIHLVQRSAFDPRTILELWRVVQQRRIELIHAHEFYTNVVGFAVAKLAGIPFIATVHGKSYYPDRWRRILAYRIMARYANYVVAVSDDLGAFLMKNIGMDTARLITVPNGINLDQYGYAEEPARCREALGIERTARVIGAVGSLYAVKGHTYLLQAMRDIAVEHPDALLPLVGKGDLLGQLEAEAREYGIANQVRFLGFRDDVRDVLGVMDVFVLPSLSEGLPMSVLEAMAMARPIVAMAVGGVPEVITDGHTGLLVPPRNPAMLAERISFLLKNPEVAENLGRRARKRIATAYTLGHMVNRYQELYSGCLG